MIFSKITRIALLTTVLFSMAIAEKVSITGVVLDKKGKGVKKIDLVLTDKKEKEVAKVTTDKKGNFLFSDLKPDNYSLHVSHKRKGEATITLKSWPSGNKDIKDLEIRLSKDKIDPVVHTFGPEPPPPPVVKKAQTDGAIPGRSQIKITIMEVPFKSLTDTLKSIFTNIIDTKLAIELGGISEDLINTNISPGRFKRSTKVTSTIEKSSKKFDKETFYRGVLDSVRIDSMLKTIFVSSLLEGDSSYFNEYIFLDGVDDHANVGNLFTKIPKDLTIEAWIRTASSNQGILIIHDEDAIWEKGEQVFYIDNNGRPAFTGYGNNYLVGKKAVNDDSWHHVAMVWDHSDSGNVGQGMIYVDGVEGTSNNSYKPALEDRAGLTIEIGTPNFQTEEAFNYFSGLINELRVWSTARTEREIISNMYETLFGSLTASGNVHYDGLLAAFRDSSDAMIDAPGRLNNGASIERGTNVVVDSSKNYFSGEYYRGSKGASPKFGNLIRVRDDSLINFQWGETSPDPSLIPVDNFQVRWTGQFYAKVGGNYRFRTYSDDGTRLYINEKLIIDDWVNHTTQSIRGSIILKPGIHDLLLEYYENGGDATCELYWTPPSAIESPVPHLMSQLITSASSANEGDGIAKISIDLSSRSGKKVTLAILTHDSTAMGNGKDYTSVSKTIAVPAGGKRITFPIDIYDDSMDEYDEVLKISIIDTTLSNADAGIARTHRLIIVDDDEPPSVQFNSATSSIAESGNDQVVVLTLSAVSGKDIKVKYSVDANSTATLEDYELPKADLDSMKGTFYASFPAGITRDTLNIHIINDSVDEHKQTIILRLTEPVSATIGPIDSHTITINDDDPPPSVAFVSDATSEFEVQGKYPYYIDLSLSEISEKDVTTGWSISSYGTTARTMKDFMTSSVKINNEGTVISVFPSPDNVPLRMPEQNRGTVTIKAGMPGKGHIGVYVLDDLIDEKDEIIVINLKPEPENAHLGTKTRHNFTIMDNDGQPLVEFSGDDHGNNRKTATLVDVGSTTTGIIELAGDIDVFRIDHKSPMTILARSGGNTDLYGEILDRAGSVLAYDDDGRDTNNFKIKIPLLPHTNYIRVKHSKVDGTGEYSLMLESSEQYDKQADDLVLNKTRSYFHPGHIVYLAHKTGISSFNVQRVQVDSVSIDLDLKRFITIVVNDSLHVNPSHCYVPSYGRYENLGIIQKNYISNPLQVEGFPRFLPEEMLEHSLVFGVVRDYRTRRPVLGAEVRVFGKPDPPQIGSQTTLISLEKGDIWGGGQQLPVKRSLYDPQESTTPHLVEKGRRITSLDGKFAIAVQDTGFLVVRAESRVNNYRIQEKKVKIRHKQGEYYNADIWLLPK